MFSRGKLAGEHVPSSRMALLRWFGLTEVDEPRKVCGADSDSSPSLFTESILLRPIAMCAFFGAGALLLGFSPPAHAVEATFVSNAGQSSDVEVGIGNLKYAQGFETGDTSGGYDLTSVEVNLSDAGDQDLTVQVREARFISGLPAPATSALYTLTPPTTLGTGFQKFTAPGNATLDPNTDYYVVVAPGSYDPTDVAEWRATHSSAQDDSGARDWRIHNRRLILFGNDWEDTSSVHKIRINAENTAPTSGHAEVATHKNENYGFRKNDFEFDDDDDHGLDHISITSLPGKGTLSLYTVDITVTPLDVTVAELDEGKLRYNPPTDASTPNDIFTTFEFKVSDGYEDSASAYTFTMKNKGPTIVGPDEISVEERTSTSQEIGSYAITVPSGFVATWEVSRNDAEDFSVLHTTSAGGQQALSVAFENNPDAEEPDDDNADNVYEIRLEVTANSLTDTLDVTVTVTDRNEFDPTVTGSAEIDYAENGTDVIGTYTIDDRDFSAVAQDFVLDLTGDDADQFTLERTDNDDGTVTAELSFNAPPDYEAPGDSDSLNDYEVTVSVSDGSKTGDLDIIVTVTDQNDAPTADAGADRTVGEGAEVTLDGSASSDPEGADLTYVWTQTAPDSGLGSAVTLDTTDPDKPTFTAPTELLENLTLTFSLTVGDGVNTSTADTVDITVTAGDNDAPTADAGGNRTVDEGAEVTLDGTASSDPEGAALSYAWTQTAPDSGLGSAVTLSDATTASPGFTAPTELLENLTLTFSLTVNDGTQDSTAATVDITVTAGDNDAPTADAGDDRTVDEGAAVTLDGSDSSDPEGADLTYVWTQTAPDSGLGSAVTLDTTDPDKPTFTAPTELLENLTLTFSLTVGDGVNTSTADTVDITVTAGDNDAPTADAGGNRTVDEGAEVTLDGTASSDPEGADLTYAWTQTAPASGLGSAVTLSDATTASPGFTAPTELLENLTLTFSLTVNDGTQDSTADTVDITVTAGDNDAPTADAGGDRTVDEGDAVTLDGSASSDPEGADLTYVWTQTAPDSGLGSAVTLDTTDPDKPTFTAPELSATTTLTFSLTVNDGTQDSTADTVDITVTADNDAPTADAGGDRTVSDGDAVTLDGSASSDPEGTALTYAWTQTAPDSGEGSAVTLDTTDPDKPTFTAPELSATTTLTFSLTVNDGTQDSTADTVDITVTADNDAPTADAGGNRTVAEGAEVTLDGTASSDPEGAALSYAWTQTAPDSGLGSAVTLSDATTASPGFTAPTELLENLTLTFSLTVNDGTQDSTADTVDITVTAGDNDAPTADAGGDRTVDEGDAVTLDGSASSDPEGADLTYVWTQTAPDSGLGSAVTLDTIDPDKPTFTAPELSATTTLTFSLTVNDGTQDSTADTVDITVTADNDAPTADAGGDRTVSDGDAVTLDGSASSDPEGTALTYAWTQTAPDSGEGSAVTLDTTDPDKPTFTAPELSATTTLTFSLTVGDGVNTSTADTVDITVTADNDAPTADAGGNRTVAEGAEVTLDGTASSDPEGADLTYAWTQTAPASGLGSAVTLSDATTASPGFTAPTELLENLTLTFSLTVNDGTQDSTADTVDITVTAGDNDAPTADAGGDRTVDEGDAVTLDGSASSDPEGADLTYVWTQTAPDSGLGSAVTLDTTDPDKPTFTAPELSATTTLTFSLTVNDGTQDSTADTVDITVTADNDAPTADAGGDRTVSDGDAVTLDGSASSDPEGTALTYAWTQTAPDSGEGSAVTLDTTDPDKPTFTAPELSATTTLTFSLTVGDGVNTSTADTVDITVTADNDAPTADAGDDRTVAEGAEVTLDGTASSDPEGADLTYAWTQTAPDSGLGSAVTLSDATTASPGFTAPTELLENLTLTFSLTVNDGTQDSTADTVDITVTAGDNDAPTADAGGDRTVDEGDAVTLDGSASSDPEGADLTYVWTQTAPDSGLGSAVTLDTTDPDKPTFTAPELSATTTLTFSLTVNDGTKDSTADTVDITVTADNDAPTADAGGDRTVSDGDAVTLDGSASSDPEGTALTYAWTQTAPDSGEGSAVTLDTTDPDKPTFTAPELSATTTLTFSLTVNDGTQDSTADTVDITVTADNDAPTADAGGDRTVAEGAAVTLDGRASSDPEGADLTYAWTQTAPDSGEGSAVTLSDATTASPGFTAPTELLENLTLTFSLTVNDGTQDSTADTVDITVTAGDNDAPTADAGDDRTVDEGDAVTLDGSASSDPEGADLTYVWTQTAPDSGLGSAVTLNTTDPDKPTFTAPELSATTTLTFSLTVNDGTQDSTADTVDITVTADNDAPTADAGGDRTVSDGDAVTLDGSASSDPEGTALTYAWTQTAPDSGEGSAVTLDTTDPDKPTFTAPELSATTTLTFSLTVNDGTQDSTADTVDITVTADNDAPTADAGDDRTVAEGAEVTLDGSASSDPEGTALTYDWTQTAPDSGLGSAVTLDTTDPAKPTFTAPTGLPDDVTLTFSLTVSDGVNTSTADTVDITVIAVPAAPTDLIAVAGDAQVSLSWTDPGNNTINKYQVSMNGGTSFADIVGSNKNTTEHTITGLDNGTEYTFALRAVNDSGPGAVSTVSATPEEGTKQPEENDAPTADAGDDRTVAEGAEVTLDGSASSDPEGADLTYAWMQTAPDSGEGSAVTLDTTDPGKPKFIAPELSATTTLTFSLTVNDGTKDSTADTVDITVTADNDAPTAHAGGDQTVGEGNPVTLNGSASSDPEGATLTYAWTQTAPDSGLGSAVPLSDETTASPSFTAPDLLATTTLTFSLTVGDGVNTSTADTVDITVTADNDAPTADAGDDRTVSDGDPVTLDGSASSDPEGTALTYAWTQTAPDSGEGSAVTLDTTDPDKPTFTAPELSATTTLTFSLTVNDGTQDSTADTVDITVTADNDAPTAHAGGDRTVGEGNPVTLDGSASSDPEGATLTYAWTQTAPDSGLGSAVALDTTDPDKPTFIAPTELLENLTLTFSLTVSDGVNTSTADTVDITVTAGTNDAPTADAGDDRTVDEGDAVTLDGSASSDPEGADLTYAWTQTAPDSGLGSAVTLDTTDPDKPTFTAPELSATTTLTFSLTVNDGTQDSTADTVDITVTADNDAPTADAGGDRTVSDGDAVTLDGRASSDPEGADLTYVWTQTAPDSGEGSAVTLSDATTASPSFTAPELSATTTLTFSLTVGDGVNTSTADTVDITVTADNDAPTADAGGDRTVSDGDAVTLDGRASSDPEGADLTYVWTQTAPDSGLGSAVTLSDATTASPSFTAPTELLENLTLTFSLTVNDGTQDSTADTVDITVIAVPAAPAGLTATAGDGQVALAWDDPGNNTINKYQVSMNGGTSFADIVGSNKNTTEHTITGLDNGTEYTFALRAVNDSGPGAVSTVSATPEEGTKQPEENGAPTAHAGDDRTVAEGAEVTLDGSASSDPEGTALTYDWTQTAPDSGLGSAVTLDTTDPAKPTFTAPTGLPDDVTLTFSLTVSDGVNTSTADTVDITVIAVPAAPTDLIAVAGDAQVSLSWTDPGNNTINKYQVSTNGGTSFADIVGSNKNTTEHTITGLDNGTEYTFALRAVNDSGPGAVSTVSATPEERTRQPEENNAPTAHAGGDQTVDEGDAVILDGSASSDPEGADLTYAWTQTAPDSGLGSAVTLSDATTASPSFTAPTELLENLTLTFSLTVNDGVNASAADTVDITVTAGSATAPPAAPDNFTATAGDARVTLTWDAADDASIERWEYRQREGALDWGDWTAIAGSSADTTAHAVEPLVNGTEYSFQVRAVNATGDGAASEERTATPQARNKPPPLELQVRFEQANYTVMEGRQADIRVMLSPAADRRVDVPLAVAFMGRATSEDFGGVPASLVFESGDSVSTISLTVFLDDVNDPGEGIVLSFATTPEAVNAGEPDSTQVDFMQQQTVEQASKSQEATLAVVALSTAAIAQAAILGRFERFRNSNRPENSAEESPPAESDHGAEAPLPGEPEPTSLEGAADTPQSGRNSADQETGTPGRWLRNVALGALGSAAGFDLHGSGSSVDSAVEPGGSTPGQDRLYGSRIGAPLSDDTLVLRDYLPNLSGLSFEAPLRRREKQTNWAPVLWVQHDLQQFSGDLRQPGLVYRGGLEAAHLGLDLYTSDRVLAGLSLMRSWGDLEYSEDGADGVLEGLMDTVHPYLYWQPNEKLSMWGIGGLGGGQVSFEETGRTHDIDADFRMLAGGVRWMLSRRGHSEWGVRTDAFTAQLGTGATEEIANASGEVRRGRLMLEWVYDRELSVGRLLSLRTEAGGRIDDGDANRGAGMETGFRLGYLDANRGLELALHGRVLAVHESDYRDWGVGLQASWDPGEKQRGFRSSFTSSWGLDGGGRTTVWENADAVTSPARIAATGNGLPYQFRTELAYAGLTAPGLPGLLTPYTRISWTRHGRELAVGTTWSLSDTLPAMSELGVSMRENQTGPAEFGVFLRVSIPLGGM